MGVSIWEGNKVNELIHTGHLLVEGFARQNLLLAQMVEPGSGTTEAELKEIHAIIQSGEASNVFRAGDQIMLNYNDGTNDYVLPWDIVDFRDVQLEDGDTKPGMILQSHYAMQGLQFDGVEASFIFPSGLAAGTYHFEIGTSWGTHCVAGKAYQFTTTVAIPEGGCIVLGLNTSFYIWGAPDVAPTNWRVYTFNSMASTTPLETLTISEGSGGTDLGTLSSSTKYGNSGANNLQRAAYGYNRWSQSAMRQFLNSGSAAGSWWASKNPYDRPPQQLATLRGFMAGFDEAFLNIIKPIKVVTALNTLSDSDIGTSENSYDTFFLASLEEEYITPQLANTEGAAWEYWRERLGTSTPQGWYADNANPNHMRYAYEAKTSPQHCRLRSAYRGSAYGTWIVSTAGGVSYGYVGAAATVVRGCPACAIC